MHLQPLKGGLVGLGCGVAAGPCLERCIENTGKRTVPEQGEQRLGLEQGGENLLMFKSYEQGGGELFYGVLGLGVGVCFPVAPF